MSSSLGLESPRQETHRLLKYLNSHALVQSTLLDLDLDLDSLLRATDYQMDLKQVRAHICELSPKPVLAKPVIQPPLQLYDLYILVLKTTIETILYKKHHFEQQKTVKSLIPTIRNFSLTNRVKLKQQPDADSDQVIAVNVFVTIVVNGLVSLSKEHNKVGITYHSLLKEVNPLHSKDLQTEKHRLAEILENPLLLQTPDLDSTIDLVSVCETTLDLFDLI